MFKRLIIGSAIVLIAVAASFLLMRGAKTQAVKPRIVLPGHAVRAWSAAFFPDGSRIATAGDDGVHIWDIYSGRLLHTMNYSGAHCAAVSHDGKTIAVAGGSPGLYLWNVENGQTFTQVARPYRSSAALSSDGQKVAAANGLPANSISIWDVKTSALLHTLHGVAEYGDRQIQVAFSPDGTTIAAVDGSRSVKIWDVKTGAPLHTLQNPFFVAFSAAYSPDGTKLASASFDEAVWIWDVKTGALLQKFDPHQEYLHSASYLPDGKRLVSGGEKTIKIWDVKTGALLQTLHNPLGTISFIPIAVSPDGRAVAAFSNNEVLIWDINDAAPAP
ncbi:MAG: WD40 repeat domain-containing protein [Candidatus Poribacteria bacterium]|nr:WD40 repeat domain-containing protein [Candidatus Poribacteria bacterium]